MGYNLGVKDDIVVINSKTSLEFHEVKELWDSIYEKTNTAGSEKPELEAEFKQLREVTNNYTVPNDVCESYEAVYNMLEEVDTAYNIK